MNDIKYILGVSGGADSMCILHQVLGNRCQASDIIVAHLNHNLRDNADSDEEFVKQYCLTNGIEFISKKENVAKYAQDNKISIETAGRILRYQFFAEIAEQYQNAIVMTAHNKNDSVESFIMHLLRGASLSGLCGIREKSKAGRLNIHRPLINMSRAEIEEYNRIHNVPYIEDETNSDTKYKRNEIRHNILPLLDIDMISKAISRLQVDEDYLQEVTLRRCEECVSATRQSNAFDILWFNSLHLALKRRIIHTLARKFTTQTISGERIDEAISAIEKNIGNKTIQFPDGIRLTIKDSIVKLERR